MKTGSDIHSNPFESLQGSGEPFADQGKPQGNIRACFREGGAILGLDINPVALEKLLLYYQELIRWNARINLTGHKNAKAIVGNLFIDSLAPVYTGVFTPEKSSTILDVGSGAGFPGLPIKIFSPEHHVTLLDSNLKKVAFLHHMIGLLQLENVRVESNRVENFSAQQACHGKFDWVFIKALRLGKGLSYISPLLSEYGKVVFHRAKPMMSDRRLQGFNLIEEIPYTLPFGLGERVLSIARPCP